MKNGGSVVGEEEGEGEAWTGAGARAGEEEREEEREGEAWTGAGARAGAGEGDAVR